MAEKVSAPVDSNVRVPRAVLASTQRANEAQSSIQPQPETPVVAPPNGDPPNPPNGALPAPAAESPAASPQEPPPPDDWEHKYKTIQGRHEAEKKRHRDQMDQTLARLAALEQQIATAAPPPKTPAAPTLNLTPEEIADYGEDLISVIRRVSENVVEGRIQPITNELGRTRAQVGVAQNRTMHQQMDALYPDWQRMNGNDQFVAWVQLPDPYSGAIRQRLMQEAWNSGDAHRVNAFFQGFLSEEAALTPAGEGRQPAVAAPAVPNGAPAAGPPLTLQQLAAPGGARSASAVPAEKPIYTAEDITRFFTEVAAGKWRHREEDRARIDADIMRAQHEGRIVTARRYTPPEPPRGFTV